MNKMLKELENERDDWKHITEGFDVSTEEGLRRWGGKELRCGLCPRYQRYIHWNGIDILFCKSCPLVILTRRTCGHWWAKLDIEPGEKTKETSKTTYLFLLKVIEDVKLHGRLKETFQKGQNTD
ncbi:MAG: hypothetical protein DRJ03_02745 [Chloroflexi bacterium]|nr:MAG: hypothetical protein DRJ03_02745 [Chloroflexota bacterium]